MAMSAKIHTLGSSAADRFNLHRAVPRYNQEDLGPDSRYPQDHLKAAQAQDDNHIVGVAVVRSERMKAVFRLVEKIARTNATVLIGGESGAGKEIVARAVHNLSLRCERPWADINCAALPDQLVESELFGYEKGAFSGAEGQKAGMFELAHGGTLFLDEIGECSRRCADHLKQGRKPPANWHTRRGQRPAGDMRSGLSLFPPRWFRQNRPRCPDYRPWLRDDRQPPRLRPRGLCSLRLPTLHARPPRLGVPTCRHGGKALPAHGRKLPWSASLAPGLTPRNQYRQSRKRACHRTPRYNR